MVAVAVAVDRPLPAGGGGVAVANPGPKVAPSIDRSAVSPSAPLAQDFRRVRVAERRSLVNVQVIAVPAPSEAGTVNDPLVTATPLSQTRVVAYAAGLP